MPYYIPATSRHLPFPSGLSVLLWRSGMDLPLFRFRLQMNLLPLYMESLTPPLQQLSRPLSTFPLLPPVSVLQMDFIHTKADWPALPNKSVFSLISVCLLK